MIPIFVLFVILFLTRVPVVYHRYLHRRARRHCMGAIGAPASFVVRTLPVRRAGLRRINWPRTYIASTRVCMTPTVVGIVHGGAITRVRPAIHSVVTTIHITIPVTRPVRRAIYHSRFTAAKEERSNEQGKDYKGFHTTRSSPSPIRAYSFLSQLPWPSRENPQTMLRAAKNPVVIPVLAKLGRSDLVWAVW